MSFLASGRAQLDYCAYNFPGCSISLRGPTPDLEAPYVAFIGGTETFGRFVERPFASLSVAGVGLQALNLGIPNAGPEVFANTEQILRAVDRAKVLILQTLPPAYQSNNFYMVHPRRNDRFIKALPALYDAAPTLDLADVHFVGHLIDRLMHHAPHVLPELRANVRKQWEQSMHKVLSATKAPVILLDIQQSLETPCSVAKLTPGEASIRTLEQRVTSLIRLCMPARDFRLPAGGVIYDPTELIAARHMLGEEAHRQIAEALLPAIREALGEGSHERARANV